MPNHNGVLNYKPNCCKRQEQQLQQQQLEEYNDSVDDGEDAMSNTYNESYELIQKTNNNNNLSDDDENNNCIYYIKDNMKTKCINQLSSLTTYQNTSPLKILICTESFHPYTSGIARRFKEIIERLAKRGFLIHIVTGCKGSDTWTSDLELKNKVTFSILTAIEFKDKIDCALPFLLPQYGILRAILEFKPYVIHCVEHTPASTFCGALGKTLNIPIVWSSHTNLDYYIPLYIHPFIAPISLRVYQLLRRTFLNLADYNLTVSSDFVKLLNENGIKQTINVWKTGVDSESFNPSYRSHEMRLKMFNGNYSPEKILLVSVGRLSPEKNFEFLLKLLERFPQAFLCIVGGGPYKESLEPLFPPNQTHFMGFLQGEQLTSAYASADYFVYASVSETFGQVYLEAMSSGIPVVAAEGSQMKEFFINGIHGYTWKPQDIDSACKALNNAIKNRNILAQNCRSNALNHSWNSAANQITKVYSKLKEKNRFEYKINNEKIFISNILTYLSGLFSIFKIVTRGIYYLSVWFYIMTLVLTFMAPFMKVTKPSNYISSYSTNKKESDAKTCTETKHAFKSKKKKAKNKLNKKNIYKSENHSGTISTDSTANTTRSNSRNSSVFETFNDELNHKLNLDKIKIDKKLNKKTCSSSSSVETSFIINTNSSNNNSNSNSRDRSYDSLKTSEFVFVNKNKRLEEYSISSMSSEEKISSFSSSSNDSIVNIKIKSKSNRNKKKKTSNIGNNKVYGPSILMFIVKILKDIYLESTKYLKNSKKETSNTARSRNSKSLASASIKSVLNMPKAFTVLFISLLAIYALNLIFK